MGTKLKRIGISVGKGMRGQPAVMSLAILVVVGIVMYGDMFFNSSNIRNILRLASILGILSIGLNLVIITGGIDLSGCAILALSGVVTAYHAQMGLFMMIVPSLLLGLALGLLNGLLVAKVRIAPFIATLATQLGIRGWAYLSTEGAQTISIPSDSPIAFLSEGWNVWWISVPFIILISLWAIFTVMMKHMRFGRHIYAVGGNMEAAGMIGVKVDRTLIYTYAIAGVLSSFAGIIMAARSKSGVPTTGQMMTLESIAAVILGGTMLTGGQGSISGCIFGAIILRVIGNMINIYGDINAYVTNFITGTLVLVVALLQARVNTKKSAKASQGMS